MHLNGVRVYFFIYSKTVVRAIERGREKKMNYGSTADFCDVSCRLVSACEYKFVELLAITKRSIA